MSVNPAPFLQKLYSQYHHRDYVSSDPIQFLYGVGLSPEEQEIIAPIAALFAYGRVSQILVRVDQAIRALSKPGKLNKNRGIVQAVDGWVKIKNVKELQLKANKTWPQWKHRFHLAEDLGLLVHCIARSRLKYRSIGNHFLSHHKSGTHIEAAIEGLATDWLEWAKEIYAVDKISDLPQKIRFLFTRPSAGSVCKRWVMWVRWMGRNDEIDPGLWTTQSPLVGGASQALMPSDLLLPLDTHVARIGAYLGIVSSKTLNWKAVLDASRRLGKVDSQDPIRFDFSIARLGILAECKKRYHEPICTKCSLFGGCRLAMR